MFDEKVFGLKNELQYDIDKYCGIFATLGDRRLQTCLFQGLTRLIQIAFSAARENFIDKLEKKKSID